MATPTTTETPSREELVERVSELVPLLREHAQWNEDNRRIHQSSLDALSEAEIFRIPVSERFGGYECDFETQAAVLTEIARGDGSTSWACGVWFAGTWLAGLYGEQALQEIFTQPQTRCSGIFTPSATATPVPGGVEVSGRWAFNTGSLHADWDVVGAMRPTSDGVTEPIMIVVPLSELSLVDDWHTAGLRGTGSLTRVADAVFVPDHRVQAIGPMLEQQYATPLTGRNYRAPLVSVFSVCSTGTAVGIARAAMESFLERLPGRKITYTDYAEQADAPLTHLQIAEASMRIAEAEFHADRAAQLVDEKAAAGAAWTTEERCRVRIGTAYACRRAKEAVDVLNSASGASSIYEHVPMQRFERDVQTLNLHALMNPNTNQELYGRVLCGRPPNTPFI